MLKLGTLTLNQRVIQAPMCGCTDYPFRKVFRKMGGELVFTPMLPAASIVRGEMPLDEILPVEERGELVGAQIMGTDPEVMRDAAAILEEQGADIIDVNLGCPVRKIVSKGAGAAMLKNPSRVGEIVRAMTAAVKIPVTVKMRQGYADSDPLAYLDVARAAQANGAAAVAIHGRTREQGYRGWASLDAIRRAKEAIEIPVIGNGDVWTGPDGADMIRLTGCDAVMIGRGGLGNPWIYTEVEAALRGEYSGEPPRVSQMVEILQEHGLAMLDHYGVRSGSLKLRKTACWYLRGMKQARQLRDRAKYIDGRDYFLELVADARREAAENDEPFWRPSRPQREAGSKRMAS